MANGSAAAHAHGTLHVGGLVFCHTKKRTDDASTLNKSLFVDVAERVERVCNTGKSNNSRWFDDDLAGW